MPRAATRYTLTLVTFVLALASAAPTSAKTAAPSRVRFQAVDGESLLVHGEYPAVQSSCVDPQRPVLHARYRGAIEIGRAADGSLFLIGELSFEEYIKGIAEVPRDWPMEALKAQVVAARTYALNRLQNAETSGDYDLCATTECQVYVGMKVEAGPWGARWVRAVEETAGQVLLYQGEPAITYYSSTSPGRTYDVEEVFGGEALPYLRGVEEGDDGASPLSRWRVEIPFDDLARFLAAGGVWGGGTIRRVEVDHGTFTVQGSGRAVLGKDDLRDVLNDHASCLAPDRYPTSEPNGYRLPQTVPSDWYRAEQVGRSLVLKGRGWGHGVGMVQWGAYGKAKRGLGYSDILGAYYTELQPQQVDVPDSISVLIADGLRSITVAPSGDATAEPATGLPPAPWAVSGGRMLDVGHAPAPAPVLSAEGFTAKRRVASGEDLMGSITLSDESNVHLEFLSDDEVAGSTETRPFEEGTARLGFPAPELPTGGYVVRAVVSDGVDEVRTEVQPVRVLAEPSSPSPTPVPRSPTVIAGPSIDDEPGPDALVITGLVGAAVIVLLVLTSRRRRGLHRG